MIRNKKDYLFYKEADRIISGRSKKSLKNRLKEFFLPDHIRDFMYLLRTVEYYTNCRSDIFGKLAGSYFKYRFRRISLKLGFNIPPNVFGPGLLIPHYGTIVINANTKVGANCVLHTCVCIAGSGNKIGDNVYFSTGVILTGKVHLTDNITISANSLINKSFDTGSLLLGGTPAKMLKERKAWYIEDGKIFSDRIHEINSVKKRLYM